MWPSVITSRRLRASHGNPSPQQPQPRWSQTLTTLAGLASVVLVAVGLYYTNAANRVQQEQNRQAQYTQMFSDATNQLGSGQTDVRLGAIYSLERLMRTLATDNPHTGVGSPNDAGTIVEILSAYVRDHTRAKTPSVTTDVQAALTVLSRRPPTISTTVDLTGANLTAANLAHAALTGADMAGADLTHAALTGANLAGADLTHAALTGADLSGADLSAADLIQARLTSANLAGATLTSAKLSEANLSGANLSAADMANAYAIGAVLKGAKLTSANLTKAFLLAANLSGAYMTEADLTGATLSKANLTDANLTDADLTGADLHDANMTNTNLTDARFSK